MLDVGNPSRPSRDASRRNEKAAANQENILNCPVWPDKNPSNDPRECKRGHRGSCSPVTTYRHQFRSALRMVSLAVRFIRRLIRGRLGFPPHLSFLRLLRPPRFRRSVWSRLRRYLRLRWGRQGLGAVVRAVVSCGKDLEYALVVAMAPTKVP